MHKTYVEEIEVETKNLPDWWNNDTHGMIEVNTIGGLGLHKYCFACEEKIPDNGCEHNKIKLAIIN